MKVVLGVLAILPGAAYAGFETSSATYTYERGAEITAIYVNDAEQSAAFLQVEGNMVTLWAEPAASGVRYAWPSDGSYYVWWTKGEGATLSWHDGENGTETLLPGDCKTL